MIRYALTLVAATIATSAAAMNPGTYSFVEYDATGGFASAGKVVHAANGAMSLVFERGVPDSMMRGPISGEWSSFGDQYCYEITIEGRLNGECGRADGQTVHWRSGGKTIFDAPSG